MDAEELVRKVETVEKQLLNITEAAEALGLGRTKCYELVSKGELVPVRIGRAVRFHVSDVIQFAEEKRREAGEGRR